MLRWDNLLDLALVVIAVVASAIIFTFLGQYIDPWNLAVFAIVLVFLLWAIAYYRNWTYGEKSYGQDPVNIADYIFLNALLIIVAVVFSSIIGNIVFKFLGFGAAAIIFAIAIILLLWKISTSRKWGSNK